MRSVWLLGIGLIAAPAAAEVKNAGPAGFETENKVVVPIPPAATYAALGQIGRWWNPSHSYSGKGENLTLELRAGGCFCERLPDGGGVEHMRVVHARSGSILRLQGGLGPLQSSGVAGSLTWALKPVSGGTEITQTYVVGGYIPGGADKLARPVDGVLAEQLGRLSSHLIDEAGKRRD